MEAAEILSMQNTFRFGAFYWLATIISHMDDEGDMSNIIDDFYSDYEDIGRAIDYDPKDSADLFRYMVEKNITGFLARFERPVMRRIGYSWGHYESAWIYDKTTEGLLGKALKLSLMLDKQR